MASASFKPWLLLAARVRPSSLVAGNWMAATSTAALSTHQIRAFSDWGSGGGGGGGGFRMRRPQGQQQSGGGGRPGRGREGGGRRGGGRRGGKDEKSDYKYGDSDASVAGAPLWSEQGFRTHMIDLHAGYYAEEPGEEGESDPLQEDEEDYEEMKVLMDRLHADSVERDLQQQRWEQNSIPPVRVPVIDEVGFSYGRGARKKAHARVWITPGFGNVTVNRMDFLDYFPRTADREKILDPMVVTQTCGKFDVQCLVRGGGKTGQAGAILLGVARALQHWNPLYRPPMKKMGYLTRDARKVEPKRVGRVKARKRPQWNRR